MKRTKLRRVSGKDIELAPAPADPPSLQYRPITTLAALEALGAKLPPIHCIIHGQRVELSLRRLTPGEARTVKIWVERALPPLIPAEKEGGEPRYDFRDQKYMEARELNRTTARAYAIYQSLPTGFWHGETGDAADRLTDPEKIREFIDRRAIEDSTLEFLFGWLSDERTLINVAEEQARINFLSAASSPTS